MTLDARLVVSRPAFVLDIASVTAAETRAYPA